MSFQPSEIKFFGNGCKVVNYYNLKSSPAYKFPKGESRSGWLSNNLYPPTNPGTVKIKSNYQYTELYNTRENYINESKKQKAPSYSFGKAGIQEDDFYKKTKNKKRAKTAKNKKNNINFDEENLNGDNLENIPNNNNGNNHSEEEEKTKQYYEIGKQFVNESKHPKAPLYSFNKDDITKREDRKFYPKNDFYETRRDYVKESKKPRILGYTFGNEKRIDPNIKKKWKYKYNGNLKENKKNKLINFEEEKNLSKGDNCPNSNNDDNINKNKEHEKNTIKLKKNDINNNNQLSKDVPHDYYNVREHYIYESKKPRVVGYSFGKISGVKPKIIIGKKGKESFFYNIREQYINESQKPKAPKYSFGRPKSFIPKQNNKNKKYILRPQSAVFNNNLKDVIIEEKDRLKNNKKIGPGPGLYNIAGNIGENAIKISLSPVGRQSPKNNEFPGPNHYDPNFKVVKQQDPIYSIGKARRYEYFEEYLPIKKKLNQSYGTHYYRRNPNWVISKNKKDLYNKILRENNRYI